LLDPLDKISNCPGRSVKNPGYIRETTSKSVASGTWTTQHGHHIGRQVDGRSVYMRQQPGRHSWRQLTAWRAALPDGQSATWLSGPTVRGILWRESVNDWTPVRRSWDLNWTRSVTRS